MTTTYRHSATFNDLAALLAGQLFLPQDADYEQLRQLFNGRVKTQPTAIARKLNISVGTAKTHIHNILRKFIYQHD